MHTQYQHCWQMHMLFTLIGIASLEFGHTYARITYRCSHGWLILRQFRSHYCVQNSELPLTVEFIDAPLSEGSTKHIWTAPSMQAQHYTFTNVIIPSKHSTVWCCHTMYLNVVAFTDIVHFLQSHLHTHTHSQGRHSRLPPSEWQLSLAIYGQQKLIWK